MNLQDWWLRLRALFLPDRVEQELGDELDFHVEMQTRKNIAAGMNQEDARRLARLHFGRPEEACRDERRINFFETLWQDVQYALRGFRKTPMFALVVIATIAVGLGVNTAVFTAFNAIALRPYDVRNPNELYALGVRNHSFTLAEYEDLRSQETPFSDVIGSEDAFYQIDGRRGVGLSVTGNYFEMLDVGAAFGRTLFPADAANRESVVVLSHAAWRTWFRADPDILGKRLSTPGNPIVVGVAREGFGGIEADEANVIFWKPIGIAPQQSGDLSIVGRLKPGIGKAQAQAGLSVWTQHVAGYPAFLRSRETPMHFDLNALVGISPIFVVFSLVLVMACANVTNMMLARAMSRQREIGIRLSLGAARARLIRQLLTESVLLALPAALLGIAISRATIRASLYVLISMLPPEVAGALAMFSLPADWRVFGFTMAAGMGSAILFGLLPTLQATRPSVVQAARGDFGNEYRPSRLRNGLVAFQITICALLLIVAGVTLRGVIGAGSLDFGPVRDVLKVTVLDSARATVVAQLASDPAVRLVASVSSGGRVWTGDRIQVALPESNREYRTLYHHASPEFFPVLDLPVLQGRNFSTEEASSKAPVAIVTSALAQRLWPDGAVLGRPLLILAPSNNSRSLPLSITVIGVVRDIGERSGGHIYLPTAMTDPGRALLLRVAGDPAQARRRILANLAAPNDVVQVRSLEDDVSALTTPFQIVLWVTSALAALALVLTVSGIYGVLAYVVAQRKKEIGMRMALGASAGRVAAIVMKQSLRLAVRGLAIAIPIAWGIGRVLDSMVPDLKEVFRSIDPAVYLAVSLAVSIVCLAASYIPSRRAAGVDPAITLRHD